MPRPARPATLIGALCTILALLALTPSAHAAPSCLETGSATACVPPYDPPQYYSELRGTIDDVLTHTDEIVAFTFYCVSTGPRIGIDGTSVYCGERRIV